MDLTTSPQFSAQPTAPLNSDERALRRAHLLQHLAFGGRIAQTSGNGVIREYWLAGGVCHHITICCGQSLPITRWASVQSAIAQIERTENVFGRVAILSGYDYSTSQLAKACRA